jgi:hypothetical protein
MSTYASRILKTAFDGTVSFIDATGTPLTLAIPFENGDFSASGLHPSGRAAVPIKCRGKVISVRNGESQEITGSFSCRMSEFTAGSSKANAFDAIFKKSGTSWASAVSVFASGSERMMVDIKMTIEGTDIGDSGDHTITFKKCDVTFDFSESNDGDTVAINYTCYGGTSGDQTVTGFIL